MLGTVTDMHLGFLGSCSTGIYMGAGITGLKSLVLRTAGTLLVSVAVEEFCWSLGYLFLDS